MLVISYALEPVAIQLAATIGRRQFLEFRARDADRLLYQ